MTTNSFKHYTTFKHLEANLLPKHVAIVMDGNGRWATQRGLPRVMGHQKGLEALEIIIDAALELGIQYLTLYCFSSENWTRPQEEINALFELMHSAIEQKHSQLSDKKITIGTVGDLSKLPVELASKLKRLTNQGLEQKSKLKILFALNYGSRWEITEAVKQIAVKVSENLVAIDDINEDLVAQHLETNSIPDPDLLIRTGKACRLSNFLLWQLSYTELYFSDLYWPDFTPNDFYEAISCYTKRERRFGKTSEQLLN